MTSLHVLNEGKENRNNVRISGSNSKCFIETELILLRIDAVNDIFTVVFGEIYKEVWLPFSSKKNFICL